MRAGCVNSVETIALQRAVRTLHELGSRHVHLAGCTAHPTGAWATQQARQFAWTRQEGRSSRFLIRDRDSKFTRDFDASSSAKASSNQDVRASAERERDR